MVRRHFVVLAFLPTLLALGLFEHPALGAAPQRTRAFILMDRNLEASPDATRMVDAIRAEVVGLYEIASFKDYGELAGIPGACSPERVAKRRKALLAGIREGAALFYDSTAVMAATRTLDSATNDFFAAPCLLAGDREALRETCEGAVLLVRLNLFQKKRKEASALARRIALVFGREMVDTVDVPPDVATFLADVRREVESSTALVQINVAPDATVKGARLYRDGFQVPGASTWLVRVPEGVHEWTLVTGSGLILNRRMDNRGKDGSLVFDPYLVGKVAAGPSGTLALVPGPDGAERAGRVAQRIADLTGATVLVARGPRAAEPSGWITVRVVDKDGAAGSELIRLRPGPDGGDMEVLVDSKGPLAVRSAWPWPWVTAGVSAGFLAAGAYLNWAANQDADAINRGRNKVASYNKNRTWAIVNYALAAAGAGTAVILYFVRPKHRSRFIIGASPVEDGAALSLTGRF
ncbi:MAG: hypothetical protein GXP54_09720 [Deltaproteobacteria bacterium]|nr:hypothetical protein [Deltaproteobacteria bacterium]